MTTPMTPEEEYDFYARPENQEPHGRARRRDGTRLSAPVPVRFPPELLEQARRGRTRSTARCRHGSDWPSSTNCARTPRTPRSQALALPLSWKCPY
jgi:hypothetical protein